MCKGAVREGRKRGKESPFLGRCIRRANYTDILALWIEGLGFNWCQLRVRNMKKARQQQLRECTLKGIYKGIELTRLGFSDMRCTAELV